MSAKVRLLDDSPSPMTVCTADLAFRDFALQGGERALPPGQLDDACSLLTDMIEIQDNGISLSAIDAWRVPEVVEEEKKIAEP